MALALSTHDNDNDIDIGMLSLLLDSQGSDDVFVREQAAATLAQYKRMPGFCSCLLDVITNENVREDLRLLACDYLKEQITLHWRQREITKEEKIYIKTKLLQHLIQANTKIALALAIVVSKVARFDYPKDWPDLISHLVKQMQATDILTSHRTTIVLFQSLKELATKRLPADIRIFYKTTGTFFQSLWDNWKEAMTMVLQSFSSISQCGIMNSLSPSDLLLADRWYYGLKLVRLLITSGYKSDRESSEEVRQVKEVCPTLLSAMHSLLPFYYLFKDRHTKLWEFTKRACTKLIKVLIAIQNQHPYSFEDQAILPLVTDFCFDVIIDFNRQSLPFEEIVMQCMILLKSLLEFEEYRRTLTDLGTGNDMTKTVLDNDRVVVLCDTLIRRHFIYSEKDLADWNNSPELFHYKQNIVQWNVERKPCAEALFIVLFEIHKEILAPFVVSILRKEMAITLPVQTYTPHMMLLKAAAYTAAGHVCNDLSRHLNFDKWFNGCMLIELANQHPGMHILHWQIALLIGKWKSEIKGETRTQVCNALITLLQNKDAAVILAACSSLCYLFDDMESSLQDLDVLSMCGESWFKLINDVQEFDSKVLVLILVSRLVEQSGVKVIAYAEQFCPSFLVLWENSTGEAKLQREILVSLKRLVHSLGTHSCAYHDMLFPIIQHCITVVEDSDVLLEDGMKLWEATLSNAPSVPTQFVDLFPYLTSIIGRSLDPFEVIVSILEGYVVLCGAEILSRHSSCLVDILNIIFATANNEGLILILPVVDILVQLFPVEAPSLIQSVLKKVVRICILFPNLNDGNNTLLLVAAGNTLARVFVMNADYMYELLSDQSFLSDLVEEGLRMKPVHCLPIFWLNMIDDTYGLQRKAFALALATIMPTVLEEKRHIIDTCAGVLSVESCENQSKNDSSKDVKCTTASHKEIKKRQLLDLDPIKQLSLSEKLAP